MMARKIDYFVWQRLGILTMAGNNMIEEILNDIIESRKKRIAENGVTLGFDIPKKRTRALHKFPASSGVIMEIKRKSPSAGSINENLDIVKQAKSYADMGAVGVSVLTEQDHFAGSLIDLVTIAKNIPNIPILRKDFILDPQEVDVAYLCGADAVLLIARILDLQTLFDCVARCKTLGLTAFIEVHETDDLKKLKWVLSQKKDNKDSIVAGVNCRDLTNFTIDPLYPAIINVCNLGVPAVYESGIKTVDDAAFAKLLGYDALLVGESVVRDSSLGGQLTQIMKTIPKKSNNIGRFWNEYAKRLLQKNLHGYTPMLKICGITILSDVLIAKKYGTDIIGFIMARGYKRSVTSEFVRKARDILNNENKDVTPYPDLEINKNTDVNTSNIDNTNKKDTSLTPLMVAVITDPNSTETQDAITLAKEGIIDAIQYHGCNTPPMSDSNYFDVARYVAVTIKNAQSSSPNIFTDSQAGQVGDIQNNTLKTNGFPRVLFDSGAGSGKLIDDSKLHSVYSTYKKQKIHESLWLAGGVTPDNAADIIKNYMPELIDVSSGVENDSGTKDDKKIEALCKIINGENKFD